MGFKHANTFSASLRGRKSFYTFVIIFLLSATLLFNFSVAAYSPQQLQTTPLPSFSGQMCGSAFTSNGTLFAGDTSYNLYRSDDRGASFRLIQNFPTQPSTATTVAGYVWTVFIDSHDRIFVSIPGTNRLYRSIDFGATFTEVSDSGAEQNDGFYIALTEDSAGNLYAASYSGSLPNPPLLKSTDGGASWTVVRTFAAIHIHNVKFNPANGYLYVATGEWTQDAINDECERVFRSKDQGQTWTTVIDRTITGDGYGDTIYLPMLFDGNYVYLGTDQAFRSNWIARIYDDGSNSLFSPHRVYDFPDDGNFPVLSGVWVNDTMVFSSTAEFSDGTSRIVASQDGINWYVVKSTAILQSQHHTNMLTSNPLGAAFYSDGVATTFKLSYPSEGEPQPSPLFSDGFESGDFSLWAGTGGSGTNTTTVETINPHHGSYDAKITLSGIGESWAQKTITASPIVYLQQYIKLESLPTSGSRIYLGTIQSDNSNNNVDVYLENDGGQYYWGIFSSINSAVYHDRESSPSNPQVGVYYCVETCRDATNSRSKLWIDGTIRVDVSRPHVGNANKIYSGISYTPNSATVYFDCVKVATTYIEPENAGPTPTPTPTPSPTPTLSPTPTPTPTGTVIYTLNMAMTATIGEPTYQETTITKAIQAGWIASDGTLYSGSGSVLYKSIDQGVSWQSLKTFTGASELASIYVNKYDQVFASPYTDAATADLGLWRSLNEGQTWAKVLPLPADCAIWGIDEDSSGNLYAGVYTTGSTTGKAKIYMSINNGSSWTQSYYDANARHIHDVAVDKTNGYIYASVGDLNVGSWNTSYIIKSVNGGSSWTKILSGLPQIVAIQAVPGARLFGTDPGTTNGEIYRTTDDSTYTSVLNTGSQSYAFWITTNSLNGRLYASFVSGESSNRNAGIYTSNNNGMSWSLYRSFTVHAGYLGSSSASNFVAGTMYYTVETDSGDQNGAKIYPQYSTGSLESVEYFTEELPIPLNFENATGGVFAEDNDSVAPVLPDPFSGQTDGGIGSNASDVSIADVGLAGGLPEKSKPNESVSLEIQVTFHR